MSIFNKSFVTGVFPNCLKHAKVIPIYKADDKFLVSNYETVSLLPVFSKVFEKLKHTRFVTFFVDKYNLIHNIKYGFRENHSTYMALLTTLDQIFQEMNCNKYSIGVFRRIKSI